MVDEDREKGIYDSHETIDVEEAFQEMTDFEINKRNKKIEI